MVLLSDAELLRCAEEAHEKIGITWVSTLTLQGLIFLRLLGPKTLLYKAVGLF